MTSPGFNDLALSRPVLEALQAIGYEQPSPIQAESIPHLLQGHDLLGTAQTGTGKTAAFALPILSGLDLSVGVPQALVLAPTRELAIQVAEAFQTYAGKMPGFHVLPIYGGQSMSIQLGRLRRGVHVVVGTPGRVMDHLRRGTLKLDGLRTVVLDEADEMLRMGFIEDVTWILEHTPEQRQVALFSATMPEPIQRVAQRYLQSPKEVKIKSRTSTVQHTEQHYWTVSGVNKLDALTRLLETEPFDGLILFVRTKTQSAELAEKLEARGYAAAAINGDMSQKLREITIDRLKKHKVDILVATDVAARGIDVPRVSHVINYDIPNDIEAYVHRIGRTGRAGRSGKAILFVAPRERRLLKAIERATRQTISPLQLPSREQVNQKRISEFKESVNQVVSDGKLEFFHDLVQQLVDEGSHDLSQIAAALAFMAQKDRPLNPVMKEAPVSEARQDEGAPRDQRDRKPHTRRDQSVAEGTGSGRRGGAGSRADGVDMETFRLAVGRRDGVKPGDIVGAIANEADMESRYIGRIEIRDSYTTVDLPAGMPKELFRHLKKVHVRGRALRIERWAEDRPPPKRRGKDDPSR